MLHTVVSGGQTGVDRAALDAARAAGLAIGGWCPRGRLAEDGAIPARYPLRETPRPDYAQRTEWNVRDADATLIVASAALDGGTALTRDWAARLGRPWRVTGGTGEDAAAVARWLRSNEVGVLNVAGPRQSEWAAGPQRTRALLDAVFGLLREPAAGPGQAAPGLRR